MRLAIGLDRAAYEPKALLCFMAIGLMGTVGFLVLLAPLTRGLLVVAVNGAVLGVMAVGIAVNRPSRPRPWAVLLAGEALYAGLRRVVPVPAGRWTRTSVP